MARAESQTQLVTDFSLARKAKRHQPLPLTALLVGFLFVLVIPTHLYQLCYLCAFPLSYFKSFMGKEAYLMTGGLRFIAWTVLELLQKGHDM